MEYSLESIMAVGTGMVSRENVEEQDNTTVNYDGYADGLDMDITRTSEQLHFMDTYDKLRSFHSSEKLRMIKKINAAYNGKTISNTNVANSVESFCNNAMSTEGVLTNIKEKLVEIFKRFCEFIKKCIMKFRMNLSRYYKLFTRKVVTGLFINESEKLINELYELNSKLIVKISHASQITSEQKDAYLLIKSISDSMIQNCFNLFSIGVNDTKLLVKNTKKSFVLTTYDPKNLHKKLNELVKSYNVIINQFNENIIKIETINTQDINKLNVDLKNMDEKVKSDCRLLDEASRTFKKLTIEKYDLEEGIREQIKQTEDNARREKIKKEFEEFDREMDSAIKSYVDELEKVINTSYDKNEDALKNLDKTMDKLRNNEKHADNVFNKIKKKYRK